MRGISAYRARTTALPLGVFAYVAIALWPPPAGSLETFAFFNWSLFSQTSDKRQDVVAIVRSIDGYPLAAPAYFYDMQDTFAAAKARDTRFAKTLDRLAFAVLTNDSAIEQGTRKLVEQHYMREVGDIEYEVAIISYNPLDRYRSGQVDSFQVLRSYSKQ
jgi:hypothetical protein